MGLLSTLSLSMSLSLSLSLSLSVSLSASLSASLSLSLSVSLSLSLFNCICQTILLSNSLISGTVNPTMTWLSSCFCQQWKNFCKIGRKILCANMWGGLLPSSLISGAVNLAPMTWLSSRLKAKTCSAGRQGGIGGRGTLAASAQSSADQVCLLTIGMLMVMTALMTRVCHWH